MLFYILQKERDKDIHRYIYILKRPNGTPDLSTLTYMAIMSLPQKLTGHSEEYTSMYSSLICAPPQKWTHS